MRLFAISVVLVSACGSAQPPAGPKHETSNTKEAATPCPKEREAAQEARELLLGSQDPTPGARVGVAVMAQASCEAEALRVLPVPSGTHDNILTGLRNLRSQMQDASNLYEEVLRNPLRKLHGHAYLGQAKLMGDFATKVAAIVPPVDLDGPAKLEFESELSQALAILHAERDALEMKGCLTLAEQGERHASCD